MKHLTLALIILLITTSASLSYEQQVDLYTQLIPGTDAAIVKNCGTGTTYTYDAYTVYAVKSPDFEGQNIYVFKTTEGQDPCALDIKKTYNTIKAGQFGGANVFSGLVGDDLFIDQWTGRDHKRVLIIDLATKSLLFFDWYDEPRIEDGVLYYNRVLKASKSTKKNIPCPDAEKWESEGLLPIYIQKAEVNLTTMKKTFDKTRSCKPVTPIAGAKSSSYQGH